MKTIYLYEEQTIIDILLPDGRWLYIEFTPNHKLQDWMEINLNNCQRKRYGQVATRHTN